MQNRSEIVDQNFTRNVKNGHFPNSELNQSFDQLYLSAADLLDLFKSQITSRHLDLIARKLQNSGNCFYTIGSSGHECNAVFGKVFPYTDMAFLHYRSCALMLQRYKQLPHLDGLKDIMLSFIGSSEDPIAGGRHKVFGSKPLLVPPQTSTISSHLPKAVGTAFSIKRAYDLGLPSKLNENSLVICSFGDASVNHASAVTAINTAIWVSYQNLPMPIVFICEDNGFGISVPTPPNWIEDTFKNKPQLHYLQCNGLNILDTYQKAIEAESIARKRKQPVFLHMKTVRLLGHAGSDLEITYNSIEEIERAEFNDPLLHTARTLIEKKIASSEELIRLYEQIRSEVRSVAEAALSRPQPSSTAEMLSSLTACDHKKLAPIQVEEFQRATLFERDYQRLNQPFHMAKLINFCLSDILLQYNNAVIFGEDVAQKGGVYNVTEGLYKKFGAKRVFNTPLDETSILGTAIGMAHNQFLPICEIQFLAYVHNAEDQIRSEAATLAYFSQGQFTNPMVIRIPGLAYQKGFGGHFHNENSLSIFRDIPGLIIAVPSNGADAVKMLRACVKEAYENGRVCIFVEPIALYMTRDLNLEGDKEWTFTYPHPQEISSVGQFNLWGDGDELLILTYGNGYYYSRQAENELRNKYNCKIKILDFCWLSPVDWDKVADVTKNYKKILIVDECRKTGSFSEAIVTALAERLDALPQLKIISAEDCFIPLGKMATAGLPKKDNIIRAALKLLGLD